MNLNNLEHLHIVVIGDVAMSILPLLDKLGYVNASWARDFTELQKQEKIDVVILSSALSPVITSKYNRIIIGKSPSTTSNDRLQALHDITPQTLHDALKHFAAMNSDVKRERCINKSL